MMASVDAFRAGRIELRTLVVDLKGLLGEADLNDDRLVAAWWTHAAPIAEELELRTEDRAPERAASDENLDQALSDFRTWARSVLDSTGLERT
jgi:hypothetical protein